jgi:hypothetical protein
MSYSIIKVDPIVHKDTITEICSNNLSHLSKSRFEWKYIKNPFGVSDVWLILNRQNNKSVGSLAVFPREVSVNGVLVRGGFLGDYSLNKEDRTLGPALSLQKHVITSVEELEYNFIYTIPNDKSRLVLRRSGYHPIGHVVWLTRPVKTFKYLHERFKNRVLAKVASAILDLMLKGKSLLSYKRAIYSCNLESIKKFDQRFDELWSIARSEYPIIENRSSEYLNWRYALSPFKEYKTLAVTAKKQNKVLGYVVTHRVDNRLFIVDILHIGPERHLHILLASLISTLEANIEAISLVYFGNEQVVRIMRKNNFFVTNERPVFMGFLNKEKAEADFIYNKQCWHYIENDEDV